TLMGPSGSGKTTLINFLTGSFGKDRKIKDIQTSCSAGSLRLPGTDDFIDLQDITPRALRTFVGRLFQQPVSLRKSLINDILFERKMKKNEDRRELAKALLEQAGLFQELNDSEMNAR